MLSFSSLSSLLLWDSAHQTTFPPYNVTNVSEIYWSLQRASIYMHFPKYRFIRKLKSSSKGTITVANKLVTWLQRFCDVFTLCSHFYGPFTPAMKVYLLRLRERTKNGFNTNFLLERYNEQSFCVGTIIAIFFHGHLITKQMFLQHRCQWHITKVHCQRCQEDSLLGQRGNVICT